MRPTLALALLTTMLALTVTGCVERVQSEHVVYVQKPPPAEIVEVQPAPPGPREVWIWQKGHWRWDGREYHWTPGHWVERPEHVNAWVAPHWEARGSNGWFFVEGRWE